VLKFSNPTSFFQQTCVLQKVIAETLGMAVGKVNKLIKEMKNKHAFISSYLHRLNERSFIHPD
jgi:hypothetical protein